MKDMVIKKKFGTSGSYIIAREHGDNDEFVLEYTDNTLGLHFGLKPGGETDGGSVTKIMKPFFDPLLDDTSDGYLWHDMFWEHRYLYRDLYKELGITFRHTNRIMKDIHRLAGVSRIKRNTTRLGVRWFGYYKWLHPNKDVRSLTEPTLFIKRIENHAA